MKNEFAGHKPRIAKQSQPILTGSTADKYPIMMDDRKTIIFISDKSKEDETRLRYMMREQNNLTK